MTRPPSAAPDRPTLADCFAGCFVINLPERTDRRREMERELATARLPAGWAEFFPAVRPAAADGFPSIGARGCFLSHLGVLREAVARRWANVLILEDDLTFDPRLLADMSPVADALRPGEWDFAYLGHVLPPLPTDEVALRPYLGPVATTHFLAVNGRCLPALIASLEAILTRPPGHPDGGPMHVDGAYSTFRAQTSSVVTLAATHSLGHQRSSASDVSPGWKDTTPVVRTLTAVARRLRRRLKPSPHP